MLKPKYFNFYYGWVIVIAGLLLMAAGFGTGFTFGIFLKPLEQNFGWSRTTISGAQAFRWLAQGGLGILMGCAADKYGPRLVLILGGAAIGLGLVLTSYIRAVWQLYIFYGLIVGFAIGCVVSPLVSTVTRWFVKRRGLALGIIMAGTTGSMVVMSPLAAWLILDYGWRSAYLIMGLSLGIVYIICALFLKKEPKDIGTMFDVVKPGETEHKEHNQAGANDIMTVRPPVLSLSQAVQTKTLWLLMSMWLLAIVSLQLIMTHVVACASDKGIPLAQAATILTLIGGFFIVGSIVMGIASDRIGRRLAFFISLFLQAIMLIWLIRSSSVWMFYAFGCAYGFGYGGSVPQIGALVADLFGTKHGGAIYGIVAMAGAAGGTIGPVMGGYLFDITGQYTIAFLIAAALTLIAAVLAILLRRPHEVVYN